MPLPKASIAASLASSLLWLAAASGAPALRWLEDLGVSPEQLANPGASLHQERLRGLLQLLDRHGAGGPLVLAFAERIRLEVFREEGRLLSRCPDLAAALTLLAEHIDLVNSELTIRVEDRGDLVYMVLAHPFDDEPGDLGALILFVALRRFLEAHFGEGTVLRAELRHPPRFPQESYLRTLGPDPRFSKAENALVFHPSVLSRANRADAIDPLPVLQQRLLQLRSDRAGQGQDALARAKAAVQKSALLGDFSREGLARSMGMSVRSLQRHLKAAGTTPKELLDEARHARALELLGRPELTLDEVAERLDFSSVRGFRKACLRWTGETPAALRSKVGRGGS